MRCYACGKFDHIAKECPLPDEEKSSLGATNSTSTHQAKAVLHRAMTITKSERSGPGKWYLDSGATEDMTPYRNKLSEYAPYASSVEAADRSSIEVKGRGSAKFEQEDDERMLTIILNNVLHVPALNSNLLSVGRMEETGLKVVFGNGKAEIIEENGDLVMTAWKKRRLYEVTESNVTAMVAKTIENELLHKRLGHLNMRMVKKLNKNEKLQVIEEETSEKLAQCEVCIKGKMSRCPFPKEATKSTKPLELVHSDVVGPIEPTTKGGSRYLITFLDDFSRYAIIFAMKTKCEALSKFKEYKSIVENFHNIKIKSLRTDNGREYRNEEFANYLIKKGITRQLTVPRTPQQNGVAEQFNRTLLEMTRCLLLESGVTKTLWADAACTACYIRNRCLSNSLDKRTLYSLWFGKEADLDHMRVFGCRAWAATTTPKKKLDARAEEFVLIGYPDSTKGYKLWQPNRNKFMVSRDVKFDESIFPHKRQGVPSVNQPLQEETGRDILLYFEDEDHDVNVEQKHDIVVEEMLQNEELDVERERENQPEEEQ